MILVTGASGYLGGNICRALIADGHTVRAFVRRSSDLSCLGIGGDGDGREGMDSSLELAYGDITDLPSLLEACAGCDVIFHTAALVEPWLPDPSRLISVNVGGLRNILQASKETKTIKKIIYTSSFFALGFTDGYVADEQQVHQGKLFCTEYEKSKVIADKIALDAATNGAPIVLLYPGVIYGSGRLTTGNILAHILIERFNGRLPGYIGHGNDVLSFVHVKDLVSAHIAAMHKGQVGERYLLTGENASLAHVFDIAAAITKTSKPRIHIPLWLIELYGWITVFFARMTGRLPLISYPTVRVLKHQWAYSCQRARDQLGYCPRSLNEGMAEVLPWLRGLGLIKY
ncbi:uncharacterized protein LOC110027609 isoform X1 [Phalaenopsis equestris]|uniref:uncharacterized protein LOC110027609 isoform X1 n=1 Tax=Phalaenopsis equestris TaxID=78828 RepID=UPI0009E1CA0E|nr:uncharacterized protein LOC110027609 isoform X1 [Phalaenopsis equestris]